MRTQKPFNLLRVTHNVSLRSLGPRSRVRGDFLVETARDDDNICYSLDPNWKNASMVYAHVLWDGNDREVTLFLEEAVLPVLIQCLQFSDYKAATFGEGDNGKTIENPSFSTTGHFFFIE